MEKRLPFQWENPKGFFAKYAIQKIIGCVKNKPIYVDPQRDERYFILRVDKGCSEDHRVASIEALKVYIEKIGEKNPNLAMEMVQYFETEITKP